MKKFRFTGKGRHVGAIGAFEHFTETVEAETVAAARLRLYDTREHILIFSVEELPEEGDK